MQTLSDIIEAEDNSYRPPHIKYETPGGFDLMDLMAFAEHGQPYEWFPQIARPGPCRLVAAAGECRCGRFLVVDAP